MDSGKASAHPGLARRSDDHGECGGLGALDDVCDHDRDVVGGAAREGEVDEFGDAHGGLARAEDRGDLIIRDQTVQAIAGEEVAVTEPGLAHGEIWLRDLHAVECAHEEVAAGMGVGLLLRDATRVDEGLHVGVVVGDLAELAVAQEIGA